MHKNKSKTRKLSKTRKTGNTQFYSLEKRLFKVNGKVFENTTTETKNDIMHKMGYLYGKKINKTINLKKYDF
jgi:hypothetical protein